MATSVYVHIPFCKSKCKYCSFVSFINQDKKNEYISALIEEISNNYKGELLKTLYFGGGTPSLISIDSLKKILKIFKFDSECEITIEVNPDDLSYNYLKDLNMLGFNRISIGSQTFDNNILNIIGRRHNSEQIKAAVKLAKKAGFKNINLDLIYGLPNQTINTLKKDLENIIALDVQHISTYGLKIEEESFWGKFPPENVPDDDIQADMYLYINAILKKSGYERYEISNFAKKGYESKHNTNYWNNNEYYGFGLAAHGYIDGIRYSNSYSLEDYLTNSKQHRNEHIQTEQEKLEEEIFLGFRKSDGISVFVFNSKYNIDFEKKYVKILDKFMPKYIEKTEKGYKLTLEGVLLSNNILSEFI